MAAILSTSRLIELILDDEIERSLLRDVVNLALLKALVDLKRDFHLRALIMEYVLKVRH
jgi:hypothetical protein